MSLELNYNGKTWFVSLKVFDIKSKDTRGKENTIKVKKNYAEKTRLLKISESENEGDSSPANYRG